MDKIKIIGGKPLDGKIFISGAKNAALPLICASLLTKDTVTLTNMPMLSDIRAMNSLLEQLGTKIDSFNDFIDGHETKTYSYRSKNIDNLVAPYDFVRKNARLLLCARPPAGQIRQSRIVTAGRLRHRRPPDGHSP